MNTLLTQGNVSVETYATFRVIEAIRRRCNCYALAGLPRPQGSDKGVYGAITSSRKRPDHVDKTRSNSAVRLTCLGAFFMPGIWGAYAKQ